MKLLGALLALTWTVSACTPGPAAHVIPSPAPSASAAPPLVTPATTATTSSRASKESNLVARTLVRVAELRGIRATRPVPGVKLDRTELVAKVKDKALREYPADALRREGQLLQIMGFAPTTFDYLNEMMTLLEAQLEGFYEPKNGTMYLASELKGKEAQATLAHELVHALQDQSWDLKSRSSYRPGKGDETLALACLAEGDATSLMMDFVMAEQKKTALDLPDEMLRELMASGVNAGPTQSVPHILRTTLIAPYVDGLGFVHALRKKGGWPAVDRAWSRPPISTEQVLHPEKWEANEPPLTVGAPPAKTLGPDFQRVDEDTFGELGFALTFEEWLSTEDARSAAAGWGGDRSAIYVNGDTLAFAVHERFDTVTPATGRSSHKDDHARNTFTRLARGLKRKSTAKPGIDQADLVCFERSDLGPLAVLRRDLDLVILAGPTTNKGGSFRSASTCVDAKRWAEEIVAAP